jgi:hypothetical protein
MKKIIILVIMAMTLIGCSFIEKSPNYEGEILKNSDFQGAVRVIFTGRAERIYLSGDHITLDKEYYIKPGEYTITWEARGYINMEVSSGGPRGNNSERNNREQRSKEEIIIRSDSRVTLTGYSATVGELEK